MQECTPISSEIMKTIICDIDGTLTNMWPIEREVLMCMVGCEYEMRLDEIKQTGISSTYDIYIRYTGGYIGKKDYFRRYNSTFRKLLRADKLPKPEKYPSVDWIRLNSQYYRFVYATGGQKWETLYVLKQLGILQQFDITRSIDKTSYRFSKSTGLPFKRILHTCGDCILISDSESDCEGARKLGLQYQKVMPGAEFILK